MNSASWNMLLATILFSLMAAEVKFLNGIPVHQIVFSRAAVTLVLCSFFVWRKGISPWGNNKTVLFLRGFFGTVALVGYFTILSELPLASATTIQYLSPVFTAALSAVFLKERVTVAQWMGYGLAFTGVAVIKGFDPTVSWWYLAVGTVGSLGAACAYTCIARLKKTEDAQVIMFYFPLVTIPIITPYTLTHWVAPNSLQWALLLGVGVTVQSAQYFMTLSYQEGKTAAVSIINYVGVLMALGLDAAVFKAQTPPRALLGIAFVVGGLVLATLSGTRRKIQVP